MERKQLQIHLNCIVILHIRASQVVLVAKNLSANTGDIREACRFDPWVGKIPCGRAWQPTLVFLPREFHGQRSLVGYSPGGGKELDTTE